MSAVIPQRASLAFLALMAAAQPGRAESVIDVGAPVTIELGGAPAGIALADFDGDGTTDIGVAVDMLGEGSAAVLLNDGAGNFGTPLLSPLGPANGEGGLLGLEAGDLDGDLDVDIAFARLPDDASGAPVRLGLNNGDGTFVAPIDAGFEQTVFGVPRIGLGDFDGDGDLDVTRTLGPEVGFNDGTGLMAGITAFSDLDSFGIEVADIDGADGPDIVYAGRVHRNDGGGSFTATGVVPESLVYAVADLDSSGTADVIGIDPAGASVQVALNQGGTSFADAMDVALPGGPDGVAAGLLNADAHPDVALSDFIGNRLMLLAGLGDGTFTPVQEIALDDALPPIAVGDLDGDGVDDVVAAHGDSFLMSSGGVTVFLSGQGCPGDANGDGAVGVNDFLALLAAWGTADPAHDLDGDGVVGTTDLLALLAAWGPCA